MVKTMVFFIQMEENNMIKTILFILLFIVIGVSILALALVNSNPKTKKGVVDLTSSTKQKKKINTIAGTALVASSLLALLIPSSFHQVEAGEVAVVKTLGKVNGTRGLEHILISIYSMIIFILIQQFKN